MPIASYAEGRVIPKSLACREKVTLCQQSAGQHAGLCWRRRISFGRFALIDNQRIRSWALRNVRRNLQTNLFVIHRAGSRIWRQPSRPDDARQRECHSKLLSLNPIGTTVQFVAQYDFGDPGANIPCHTGWLQYLSMIVCLHSVLHLDRRADSSLA